MHSNYQDMQADLQYLNNRHNQMLQHNSLQSEMQQHYPGIQQDYQNTHPVHQQKNYYQQSNNCGLPNGQNIQHDNVNPEQWHSLINQPSMPVLNNYDLTTYQQQQYINQLPISNTIVNSNSYNPTDNHYLQQESYDQTTMQPNKDTQSQQFFLHAQQQKFRKSWDIVPSPQTHTFAQEPQNIWNGR